ncbi:insecticidal delta-endotoxin Cry8Ea1 family protein [Bacillus cereus]
MKYKDRIQAKRNYKQTIFTAATTLTLGVSVLAGPVSAFAAEKEPGAQKQVPKTTENTKDTQIQSHLIKAMTDVTDIIKVGGDGSIEVSKEFKDDYAKKALSRLGGTALQDAYKNAHGSNLTFNDFSRDMVIAGTTAIPYGGAFIAPLLGILWPSSVNAENQMQKLIEQISAIIDQKIVDYDKGSLKTDVKALMNELQILEDSVNGKPKASLYEGSIQETNRTQAKIVNTAFHKLIENCQKEEQYQAELPIYVIAATAHLEFLKFIETNGKGPRMQFDDESLQTYFLKDLKDKPDEYKNYIKKTADETFRKISKQISGNETFFENSYRRLNSLRQEIRELSQQPQNMQNFVRLKAVKEEEKSVVSYMEKIITKIEPYALDTVGSAAFQVAYDATKGQPYSDPGNWVKKGGGDEVWYFQKDGNTKKGWIKDKGSWYYLSPEMDGRMLQAYPGDAVPANAPLHLFSINGHIVEGIDGDNMK